MPDKKTKKRARSAYTTTTTYLDPADGLRRTALIIEAGKSGGSVDIVTPHGGEVMRLAQVNISVASNGADLMIDVIDVEGSYKTRSAITFDPKHGRDGSLPAAGPLVAVYFEREQATGPRPDDLLEQKRLLTAALKAIAESDGRGAAEAAALRKIARAALESVS